LLCLLLHKKRANRIVIKDPARMPMISIRVSLPESVLLAGSVEALVSSCFGTSGTTGSLGVGVGTTG
jgi:hypothetical protein